MEIIPDISHLQEELKSTLLSNGADLIGFADISELKLHDDIELFTAISVGIAFDLKIVRKLNSDIDSFKKNLTYTNKKLDDLLQLCKQILVRKEYTALKPSESTDQTDLITNFSHKMAATKAGLGWIGKNSLFTARKFGCGVSLATLLTNAPFTTGEPVTKSRCGNCIKCVDACPYGAIKGATWFPGIERDKLLNAFVCSEKRKEYITELGYKHPCGLCIKACPIGKK